MTKIHIHTPSFFPSLVGMTYAAHARAEILSELGAKVSVIAPGAPTPSDEGNSYRVRRFDIGGSGLPWNPIRGEVDALLDFTREDRPDIVISEGWFTIGTHLLPTFSRLARHTVLSSHGSADLTLGKLSPGRLARLITYMAAEPMSARKVLPGLSAAIVLSDYRGNTRFRDTAWFEKRGMPVFTCANPSIYSEATEPRALNGGAVRLLHVGEMSWNKNQLAIIDALAELPANVHAIFAFPGDNGYSAAVRERAKAAGVESRVEYVIGWNREALEAVYDRTDLLMIASFTEAQPITASDGLAKGIPFVSTPVGCMQSYAGGVVAEAGGLGAAVGAIIADRTAYSRLSAAGLHFYREHLSPQQAKRSMRDMLDVLQ